MNKNVRNKNEEAQVKRTNMTHTNTKARVFFCEIQDKHAKFYNIAKSFFFVVRLEKQNKGK